jgi:hypothetical protein
LQEPARNSLEYVFTIIALFIRDDDAAQLIWAAGQAHWMKISTASGTLLAPLKYDEMRIVWSRK